MKTCTIDVAEKCGKFPFGRYRSDGEKSAEVFRDDILIPALDEHDEVTVDLSGTLYYSSSFLEETFGGLVRKGYAKEDLQRKLKVMHRQLSSLVEEAEMYIAEQADSRQDRDDK